VPDLEAEMLALDYEDNLRILGSLK